MHQPLQHIIYLDRIICTDFISQAAALPQKGTAKSTTTTAGITCQLCCGETSVL
jgi:hypothetical protein